MPRGSRLEGSPVVGSSTSHTSTSVVSAKKGSIQAVAGSGIRFMSDSWIAFQPAIEEPSNIWPSAKVSSSIKDTSKVTCCHLPRGSVNRKSAYFTSLSLIIFMTFLAVVIGWIPPYSRERFTAEHIAPGLDGVDSGLAGPDPDSFLNVGQEDFPVSDPASLSGAPDRLDRFINHIVGEHDLDFHFGEEIDHVLSAAIKLSMSFLATESFGFGDRNTL